MQILLLGAGGFIGSHLADWFVRDGNHDVIGFDQYDEKLEDARAGSRFHFVRGDLRECGDQVRKMVRKADVVVDLIAHANPSLYVKTPMEVFRLNFTENMKIVDWCVEEGKRLVQFSSCEVYGKTLAAVARDDLKNPDAPRHAVFSEDTTDLIMGPVNKQRWIYASAKQLLERVLHALSLEGKLDYSIIRPFNFIGPRIDYLTIEQDGNPRVFSHFMTALLTGRPMPLVDGGTRKRCYTYIDDAVDCIARVILDKNGVCRNHIFNVGSPYNETSIAEMAVKMRDIYAAKYRRPGEPLPEIVDVPAIEFYGEGYEDSDRRIPDITKARTLLGWEPKFDLNETLDRSMRYYVQAYRERKIAAAPAKA
jgi:nucleoside-diphosphate-sugar epimerase